MLGSPGSPWSQSYTATLGRVCGNEGFKPAVKD